jgi:hypothetical protein
MRSFRRKKKHSKRSVLIIALIPGVDPGGGLFGTSGIKFYRRSKILRDCRCANGVDILEARVAAGRRMRHD